MKCQTISASVTGCRLRYLKRRLDLSRYDRITGFTERELLRIAAVVEGESIHVRLDDPLARLLHPAVANAASATISARHAMDRLKTLK